MFTRNTTLFFAGILAVVIVTSSSCKKNNPAPPANNSQTVLSATFGGQIFNFTQGLQMTVLSNNTDSISGLEPGTDNTLTLNIGGADTGTYMGSSSTYITLFLGNNEQCVSNTPGGSCKVTITEFNRTTMWAKGTFSGTVVSAGGITTLVITNGTFYVQFQG